MSINLPKWFLESFILINSDYLDSDIKFQSEMDKQIFLMEKAVRNNPNIPANQRWTLGSTLPYMFNEDYLNIVFAVCENRESTYQDFLSVMDEYQKKFNRLPGIYSSYHMDEISSSFSEMGFRLICAGQGNRTYTIRNQTLDMLSMSTIDYSVPFNMLKPPEEGITYVELGEIKPGVKDHYFISETEDGYSEMEMLDGFFVSEKVIDSDQISIDNSVKPNGWKEVSKKLDIPFSQKVRVLSFCFCGAVNSDAEMAINTGYQFANFYSPYYEDESVSEGISLVDLLEKHQAWWESSDDSRYDFNKQLIKNVKLAALMLLYISSSAYREEVNHLSEAVAKIHSAGTKKKDKRLRQAYGKFNRIYLSPEKEDKGFLHGGSGGTGKSISTHFRKGYLRMQRYGEGRTLSKVVWIKPVIVNPGNDTPKSKNHLV